MNEPSHLIVGEQILASLENSPLVLTNYRVRFDWREMGGASYQSISLDAIAYCGFISNSQPVVLVFGLLFGCVGAAGIFVPNTIKESVMIGAGMLLVSLAFLIIYFATRSAVLAVCSTCDEKITIAANRVKREQAIAFLEAVLEAKLRFNRKILSPEKAVSRV